MPVYRAFWHRLARNGGFGLEDPKESLDLPANPRIQPPVIQTVMMAEYTPGRGE